MIEVPLARLPKNWRSPLNTLASQRIGDEWLAAAKSVALKVPSAIAPMEFHYLLNPSHPDFKKRIRWSKAKFFEIEPRLLQNS